MTQHDTERFQVPAIKINIPMISFTGLETAQELFWKLTSFTCPHGYEVDMYGEALEKLGWERDTFDNYHLILGENNKTCFTAHMDTASYGIPNRVNHVTTDTEGHIVTTDGKTLLGADDKAGMTVLLKLAHAYHVPAHYILFVGEERGCIGSKDLAKRADSWMHFDRMISFDRKDYWDIITFQCGERCCSDTFAAELATQLNAVGLDLGWNFKYKASPDGLYTDSASFTDLVPECTNISVGYFGAHGMKETQDTQFLDTLIKVAARVSWEALPTLRDPKVQEFDTAGYGDYAWYGKGTTYSGWNKETKTYTTSKPNTKDVFAPTSTKTGTWLPTTGGYKIIEEMGFAQELKYSEVIDWVRTYPFVAADMIMQALHDDPYLPATVFNSVMGEYTTMADEDTERYDARLWEGEDDTLPVSTDRPPSTALVKVSQPEPSRTDVQTAAIAVASIINSTMSDTQRADALTDVLGGRWVTGDKT